MPANAHTPPEWDKAMKRWIALDLVQNTAEYLGRVPSLLSFRGVSTSWQGAVSDAVGFLNGCCWTELGKDRPLWRSLCLDDAAAVARCALLCLGPRLETLKWWHSADHLDFSLRLLGESNTVLTTLSLVRLFPNDSSTQTTDVGWLRNYQALKILNFLNRSSITDAGIRGLELIRTLEELYLNYCNFITDVSFLRDCRVLKKLDLSYTAVTDAGIRGLELIPTLEVFILFGCRRIADVSCLRSCPALKSLVLSNTSVTDAGIRGLELILTLTELYLHKCRHVHDLSALRHCLFLRIIGKPFCSRYRAPESTARGLQ
jgi:hypothetical protein